MSASQTPDFEIVYEERAPDVEAYAELFETTGWNSMYGCSPPELEKCLERSWCLVAAYTGDTLVGAGRLMSDGILYAVVFDMIVAPAFRGRGIGSGILRRMLENAESAGIRDVLLFSARGVREFYSRHGFAQRPEDAPGMLLRRAGA